MTCIRVPNCLLYQWWPESTSISVDIAKDIEPQEPNAIHDVWQQSSVVLQTSQSISPV
jgi:hypothetical protein